MGRVVEEERELSSSGVEGVCSEGGVEGLDCADEGKFWVWDKDDVLGARGESGWRGRVVR